MLAIGLMSGTSADGVDAALVDVESNGEWASFKLLAFETMPYIDGIRDDLINVARAGRGRVDQVCALNVLVGELFAGAALDVCATAGVSSEDVEVIGSHGQTIHHLPDEQDFHGTTIRSTLQIGDPAVIAERSGIKVVSDFRSRDVAVGGQGAPLVPRVDYLLFRSDEVGRVMLNVGGIANLTALPKACNPDDVFAFDTGPGNMIIDGLVSDATDGAERFDRDGLMGRQGRIDEQAVNDLMTDSYFAAPPPKSTGRERFGDLFVERLRRVAAEIGDNDLVSTASALTARSVGEAIERHVRPRCDVQKVYVSGGGVHNPYLMELLDAAVDGCSVSSLAELGLDPDAKEAVAFAILAVETLAGRPGNLPGVTGARKAVILGNVTV